MKNKWSSGLSGRASGKKAAITGQNRILNYLIQVVTSGHKWSLSGRLEEPVGSGSKGEWGNGEQKSRETRVKDENEYLGLSACLCESARRQACMCSFNFIFSCAFVPLCSSSSLFQLFCLSLRPLRLGSVTLCGEMSGF